MRTKNLTKYPAARVAFARGGANCLAAVVRGRFVLVPGRLEPSRFVVPFTAAEPSSLAELDRLAQQSPTHDVLEGMEVRYPSDFALFKPRTDVLLRGHCHAPLGRKVTEQTVGFGVGAWHKRLRVVGPRVWVDRVLGGKKTDPLPFDKLPVDYAHAYGGPAYAPNPAGTGHESKELPYVELLDRDTSADTGPAGFGPLDPDWPQRAQKRGKNYGKDWLQKRAPGFSDDFDWGYFNAAPADQQLEGYLRGDEELRLEGFHPEHTRLVSRLPGLRVRVFLQHVDGRQQALAMRLDTLFVDVDEGVVYLTWRGVAEVKEDDLSDVAFALVAEEKLDAPALPDEHYLSELAAFANDPVGLGGAFPDGPEEAKRRMDAAEESDELPSLDGGPDPVSALLKARMGGVGAEQQAQVTAAMAGAKLPPSVDLKAALRKAQQEGGARLGAGMTADGAQRVALAGIFKQVLDQSKPLREKAAGKGVDVSAFAKLDSLARDPKLNALDPTLQATLEGTSTNDEPGPGADLRGRDLSGADLRGRDLSGADLEGANLSRADLSGANLRGAKLGFSVLYKAKLEAAILEGAVLTSADLSLAKAAGANLSGVKLDRATLRKTDLSRAVLRGASGLMATFTEAKLEDVDAEGAILQKVHFGDCVLDRASFRGATLEACIFWRCRAPAAVLAQSKLNGTAFNESAFTRADFTEAQGKAAIWLRSNVEGADFSYATLPDAQLQEVMANDAKLVACNLREARFYRASLRGADFTEANLFGADLRKAVLTRARFTRANLYDAKLMESLGTGVDFGGAVLAKANFLRSQLVRL